MNKQKNKLRLIIFIVLLLMIFVIFLWRLIDIQLVSHQDYLQLGFSQYDKIIKSDATRGDILDRNYNMLATNHERLTFVYQSPQFENNAQRFEKAQIFVDLFNPDLETMAFRDKQEALLYYQPQLVQSLLTQEQKQQISQGNLTTSQQHQILLDLVTEDLIKEQLTLRQLQDFMIYIRMNNALNEPVVLKEKVSPKEVSLLYEQQHLLEGISIQMDWDRLMINSHHLKPLIGSLSTQLQGIPRESALSLQALNYRLNDRIGLYGLESYYESLLRGISFKDKVSYDANGIISEKSLRKGHKGLNLISTIDVDFQNFVEEKIGELLLSKAGSEYHKYFKNMLVVVSNPNNGEVIVSAGVSIDDKHQLSYQPSDTYLQQYSVGSAIKGAVVYLALSDNLMQAGEKIMDEPIKIAGTQLKKSFQNLGLVDDIDALAKSSNVYMFHTAIRLGKGEYEYDKPLNLDSNAFNKMRANFGQFGLGVHTGLDVDHEATGYKSNKLLPGYLLDFSIGQFETYTAMQLNQYVSTIANGKYRYKLRLVRDAIDPLSKTIVYQNQPEILNVIDDDFAIERVQLGFRECVLSGYCTYLKNLPINVAAKTGSAEIYLYDDKGVLQVDENNEPIIITTNTIVGYGPVEKPEIAVSCIAPNYQNDKLQQNGCELILKEIFSYYSQR